MINDMKMVNVLLNGNSLRIPDSTPILALVANESDPGLGLRRPIGALVNNRRVSLNATLYEGAEVKLIDAMSSQGLRIYRRGCILMLLEATRRLFPQVRLVVGQSLGDGFYFDWTGKPDFSNEHLDAIRAEMENLVAEDLPFEQERTGVPEALRRFESLGLMDRVELLNTFWHETIRLIHLGGTVDIHHGPTPPSTSYLNCFGLAPYSPGFVMRFPEQEDCGDLDEPPPNTQKLFDIHRQSKEWNKMLRVENIGTLNRLVIQGGINELIRVSEGFHEKRIAEIASRIVERRNKVRMVLIAGPSSSGKTTFLKRLSVQLKCNGLQPVGLSIDNYYVNREDTPRDENGDYDFEAIEAIDLPLFNQHLVDLLDGREIATPRFNFETGKRTPKKKWRSLKLDKGQVLVIEGIHGLNDRLTSQIPQDAKFKIYVSALSQLCLDDANRIHTTDLRLMRRTVRDRLYRGYSASETLATWPSVRRGESRNIFPFQEAADEMFNTALPYEAAVLKVYAERFLLDVTQDDPNYHEVHRLMKLLSLIVGIFPDRVPQNSILREFIGGSTFRY